MQGVVVPLLALRDLRVAVKILTVLAGAPTGGAETFFVSLTTALHRAGLEVRSVLKPSASRQVQLAAAGIGYTLAPFGGMLDFTTRGTIRRAAEAFRPDAVLAFAGRAASLSPRGSYTLIGRLGGYYNLNNFRHCDHLVCNAPDLVRHVTESGFPKERAHLIPNFPSVPDSPPIDRATFQTPKDVPLAVALGRLHKAKALDILLKAALRLPGLWVWIAGEGEERQNLERLAHELGIQSRTRFLGWREDRAALYRAADVLVYPSREEPFGNVVVEAWSCGAPIVTTASIGPKWLVKDGEDAILVPINDPEALANGITKVLSSQDLAASLVRAGYERVAKEFSEGAIVRSYISLFEQARR
jgi:glycosyltransferase involved in cell wall biosynthesis